MAIAPKAQSLVRTTAKSGCVHFVLPFIAATALGCTPAVKSASDAAARTATPAVADSALGLMEDPQFRARLAKVLASPEVQRSIAAVSGAMVRGAIDEVVASLPKLVDQLKQTVIKAVLQGMSDLGPATEAFTKRMVGAAFGEALSTAHQQALGHVAALVTSSVLTTGAGELNKTVGPALHKMITDDVAPAIGEGMTQDMLPAVAKMLASPKVRGALAAATREIAHEAVLGSNDALAELAEKKKANQGGGPIGAVIAFFGTRTWLLAGLVVALALALPIVWLTRERKLAQRYRDEAERRNHRAAALVAAMEALRSSNTDTSKEVLSLLRAEFAEDRPLRDPETVVRGPAAPRDPPPAAATPSPA